MDLLQLLRNSMCYVLLKITSPPDRAELVDYLGLVATQALEASISDCFQPKIPPLPLLLRSRDRRVLETTRDVRELCDELLEIADLGPVGDEVLAEREGFEDVEPLENGGELRFEDASEVGVRELVEVEYDGFVDDWRVGGRWNGSETLFESGLGTVEDTFTLGLGGGGATLTLELDGGTTKLASQLMACT